MKTILIFIFCFIFGLLQASAQENVKLDTPFYKYQVQSKEGLGQVLRKLGYAPLWREGGWVEKIALVNKLSYKQDQRVLLKKNQWLKIPAHTLPKTALKDITISRQNIIKFKAKTNESYSLDLNITCKWSDGKNQSTGNCNTKLNSNLSKDSIGSMSFTSELSGHKIQFSINNSTPQATPQYAPQAYARMPALTKQQQQEPVYEEVLQIADVQKLAIDNNQNLILADNKAFAIPKWEPSFNGAQLPEELNPRTPKSVSSEKLGDENYFFPQLGVVNHNFTQGAVNYRSTDLNAMLAYRRILHRPNWHIDSDLNVTLATLSKDGPDLATRFTELNARVGYSLPVLNEPWRFTLFAGLYAASMNVETNSFGYKPLLFPQLYPEVRRVFQSGDLISLYGKWMPTAEDSSQWFSGPQQALSIGVRWSKPEMYGYPMYLNFEYSNLNYVPANSSTTIQSDTIILGIGTSL